MLNNKIEFKYIYSFLTIVAIISACKKPYTPVLTSSPDSYMVVEGVINSGGDSTSIRLSKTVQVAGNVKANMINNSIVTVESEQGVSYTLQSTGDGRYVSAGLPIDASKKYRLHIITHENNQYVSDYLAVKPTPPIDSVTFGVPASSSKNSVEIAVNTHDPANNTRYYRWDYVETWKFRTKYYSSYIVDNGSLRPRQLSEQINLCFGTAASANVNIASTANLTQDVVSKISINTIPPGSEKLGIRYSILVRQYSITKDEYQFWFSLKKNTEQLGGIFDAQPTQLTGNIHNLKNPTEPVIGYASITNVQTKRLYINNNQVPANGIINYPYACEVDTAYVTNPKTQRRDVQHDIIEMPKVNIPIAEFNFGDVIYSSAGCTDCTIRGKTQAPSFWIE